MKFISKSSNLNIILRPGLPAQPITGSPATPTIYVKFQDGVAEIEDESLVEMMLNHPGYNADFVSAEEGDPFSHLRPRETSHVQTEMKYGHPVSRSASPVKPGKLPENVSKLIREQALDLAKQMLPDLLKEALQGMVTDGSAQEAVTLEKPEEAVTTEEAVTLEKPKEAPKTEKPKAAAKKKAPAVNVKK